MTWVTRIAEIVKLLVFIVLELIAIGTEALKLLAEHLDAFVDDLQGKVTKPPA